MADFEIAFGETSLAEGGYVNDPVDRGGETYRGIARKFHSDWPGWKIVDRLKSDFPDDFKQHLDVDAKLPGLVKDFYREKFWLPIWGDKIHDQHIANEVYDTGVNQGVQRSIRYLQDGLNLLNRNPKNYSDIAIDGRFGEKTLGALQKFLKLERGKPDYLLKIINIMQAYQYVEIMRKTPSQQRFARGWLNRVQFLET